LYSRIKRKRCKFISVKKLFLLLFLISAGLKAQDTIRFRSGEAKAVKVQEVGLKEIKYNRFDNLTGPMYVCSKDEVSAIRYANGSVDTFTSTPVKTETPSSDFPKYETTHEVSQPETPAYVNTTPPVSETQSSHINISGKKLYYEHKPLNEKGLLSLIKNHPDAERRSLMLREFSKIPVYKNNRMIGIFLYAGGTVACFGALVAGSGTVFLVATAVTITGCVIATVNKHKRTKKRVDIAKIYNGDSLPSNNTR
jgi:hypothetical protein